jgi:hypothetical protein
MHHRFLAIGLVIPCGLLAAQTPALAPQPASPLVRAAASDLSALQRRMPMSFVENAGQYDARCAYVAYNGDLTTFIAADHFALQLTPREADESTANSWYGEQAPQLVPARGLSYCNVFLRWDGAQAATLEPQRELPTRVNYLLGRDPSDWHTDVSTYGQLSWKGLYDGVDIELRIGNRNRRSHVEYDVVLAPGADLAQVVLAVEGANAMRVEPDGALVIDTAAGPLRQEMPAAWQIRADGSRESVTTRFRVVDEHRFGFEADGVDPLATLVVDPLLVYSTYVGGMNCEMAFGVDAESAGDVVAVGLSQSSNYPTTPGAFDPTWNNDDVLVTRLDSTGSTLLYSTFIGGTGKEGAQAVRVLPGGDALICGSTASADFPVSAGAFDTTLGGHEDAFVLRLSSAGSALLWSTYLGGGAAEEAWDLRATTTTGAVVCGRTWSGDFPASAGAFDTTLGGGSDAFVARIDAGGATLAWATYLGGGDEEIGMSVGLAGAAEQVYVGGTTYSNDFPVTPGAFDTSVIQSEGYVARFTPDGATLLNATYLGGSDAEALNSLDVHLGGSLHVSGTTGSSDFPTTLGSFDTTFSAPTDGYIARLKPDLSALEFSTYIGGNARDEVNGVVADPNGITFFIGTTFSTDMVTAGSGFVQTAQGGAPGSSDVYLGQLSKTGAFMDYATYMGGPPSEHGYAVTLDFLSYIAFYAGHARDNFPTTTGAFDTTFNGGSGDIFVARIDPRPCPNPAAVSNKATGCGGYTLTPSLPIMGALMTMSVQGPPNTLGVLYFSQAGAPNLVFAGCEIGLDLTLWSSLLTFTTNASGLWSAQLPVFNDPPRCGQQIVFQAGLFSPAAGPAFFGGVTNAVTLTEGS